MACSGAFSQTSSSASHFPSCSRVNVTHKNRERFDGEIKKRVRTARRAGRCGKKEEWCPPPPSNAKERVRVIPRSRACVFRRKCNKTSGAATRHQNGQNWLQRVFRCLRSRENRRYQQAVNNQYGNHARKTLSSQNANRHQISEGFYRPVIPHLSSFICSKWKSLKARSTSGHLLFIESLP